MRKLIYLDNCCFNRPYDDQTQPKVAIETLAKLHIQELVLKRELDIVWSYILKFENSRNIFEAKRAAIAKWEQISICAVTARCDYMVTVDNRILKYRDNRIVICNPVDFINRESNYDQ